MMLQAHIIRYGEGLTRALAPGASFSSQKASITRKIRAFMDSKLKYDSLLSKYDVFKEKEKSIEYAAAVVGLKPPRMK